MIGRVLEGRYKIAEQIGAGGMGTVYAGVHTGTGRRVAIKVISQDLAHVGENAVRRFRREARTAGTIETKHIVEIIDVSTDPETGAPYMVMEMMSGEDVKELAKRAGPLPWKTALAITIQACRGLEKAHESGVIHRDIKPANLFLDQREGDIVTVKVLDFGVAKIKEEDVRQSSSGYDITKTGTMLGSPLYMSPEQARGLRDIDHRSDLWSVGVVLYRMLAGRAPFQDAESLGDLIVSICSAQTPPLQDFAPWVPRDIAAIVHACLVADRSRRFASARDMIEALLSVLPEGDKLTKDMLVGATELELQVLAPRFDVSGSGADQLELSGSAEPQDNPVAPLAIIEQAQAEAAKPTAETSNDGKGRLPFVVAMGVGLAAGAYGVYRFTVAQPEPAARGLGALSASANAHVPARVAPTTAVLAGSPSVAEPTPSASSAPPAPSASVATAQSDAAPVAPAKPIKSPLPTRVRASAAAPPPVSTPPPAPVRPAPPRQSSDPFGGRK